MRRYGCDKPDTRYGLELVDLANVVRGTEFGVFKTATDSRGLVEGIVAPGGASFSRKEIDDIAKLKQAIKSELLSILNAMDIPDTTFGQPSWCTGSLAGFV